jgi:hypothetical protein
VTVALLVVCGVMSVMQPQAFASTDNFYNITRNFAFIGIIALGMTAVIATGGIDLSVGSVMGLAAIATGLVLQAAGPWSAIGAGLVTGAVNGAHRLDRPAALRRHAGNAVDRAVARRGAVAEQNDLTTSAPTPRRSSPSAAVSCWASPTRYGCC